MSAYVWKTGFRCKVAADIAGAEFERLEKTGGLTAERLVDESRSTDAVFHDEFEWRDDVAAEEYRKAQARCLIGHLCVLREDLAKPSENTPVRAYFTVEPRVYNSVDVVMKSTDKRTALLRQAYKDMQTFTSKYKMLTELAEVIAAMDAAEVAWEQII